MADLRQYKMSQVKDVNAFANWLVAQMKIDPSESTKITKSLESYKTQKPDSTIADWFSAATNKTNAKSQNVKDVDINWKTGDVKVSDVVKGALGLPLDFGITNLASADTLTPVGAMRLGTALGASTAKRVLPGAAKAVTQMGLNAAARGAAAQAASRIGTGAALKTAGTLAGPIGWAAQGALALGGGVYGGVHGSELRTDQAFGEALEQGTGVQGLDADKSQWVKRNKPADKPADKSAWVQKR